MDSFRKFLNDDGGQDLVEYGLLLSLVALIATGVLLTLGADIGSMFVPVSATVVSATK